MDAAYTPNLDSYLVPLIAGIKSPDKSLRDVHDKICDIFGPLGVMYENLLPLVSVMENGKELTLNCQAAAAFMNCLKKSVMSVGDVSAIFTIWHREQVLARLNASLASLGKEQFPDAEKQLFGEGFKACLKARSETARTFAAAHNAGKSFFPKTASRGWLGHVAGSFAQKPAPAIFSTAPDKTCIQSEPISIPKHKISDSQKSWEGASQLPKTQQSQTILKTSSHLPTDMSLP